MGNVLIYQMKQDPERLFSSISKMAKDYKINFRGDSKSGSFAGGPRILGLDFKFKGRYEVKGDKVYITVEEKPALVSYEQTFEFLRKILAGI